jgi:hypothetical protein
MSSKLTLSSQFNIFSCHHPDEPIIHAHFKGFDEVMPHNDNEFLVKTIENVEEKLHFLSFFGEK